MFRAAFTSRSCGSPQPLHVHALTASCLRPCGPLSAPHCEQAREVFRSLTTSTDLPACSPLYCSICLSIPHPLSSTDFASRVLASFGAHIANDDVLILVNDPATELVQRIPPPVGCSAVQTL